MRGRRWGWIGGWGLRGRVAVGMGGDESRCSAPRWMRPRHVALGCVRLCQVGTSASSSSPRTPAHNFFEKMIPYQQAYSVFPSEQFTYATATSGTCRRLIDVIPSEKRIPSKGMWGDRGSWDPPPPPRRVSAGHNDSRVTFFWGHHLSKRKKSELGGGIFCLQDDFA